jgi:hypothetical protein
MTQQRFQENRKDVQPNQSNIYYQNTIIRSTFHQECDIATNSNIYGEI